MQNPPTTIRIGAHDYDVEPLPEEEAQQNQQYGDFSKWDETIRIRFNGSVWQIADTLIHEVLHALYYHYKISKKTGEEKTVSCLSSGITQVIRDNDDWVLWLSELLYEDSSEDE